MRRDLDLIRELLLVFEQLPLNGGINVREIELPPWTRDEIIYNSYVLWQSGLVEAVDCSSNSSGRNIIVRSLRPAGHDYLDAVRSDQIWGKVKARTGQHGLEVSLDVAKSLAVTLIGKVLGVN